MAGRSRSTFGKRQKEMKRLEKRQDKAARKDQRKQEKISGGTNQTTDGIAYEDAFRPGEDEPDGEN